VAFITCSRLTKVLAGGIREEKREVGVEETE